MCAHARGGQRPWQTRPRSASTSTPARSRRSSNGRRPSTAASRAWSTATCRLTFAELADGRRRGGPGAASPAASSAATGWRSGRPNSREWVIAALGVHRAGAVVVTAQHPVQGRARRPTSSHRRAPGCCSRSPTSSTPTTWRCCAEAGTPDCLEEIVVLRRRGARGHDAVGRRSSGGRPPSTPATTAARAAAVDARRPERHPLHVGHDRRAQGRDARATRPAVRAYTAWSDVVGLREGDRYLIVNPFFHAFGLKAGILACLVTGATIIPHPVFDVPSVMRRVDEERITMLPGAAGDLPDDPRPPRPRPRSTCRRCAWRSPARRRSRSR